MGGVAGCMHAHASVAVVVLLLLVVVTVSGFSATAFLGPQLDNPTTDVTLPHIY